MPRFPFPDLTRLRLAPRLIIVMFFVLLTIVVVNLISRQFTSMPEVQFFERSWLIDQVVQTRDAFAGGPRDNWAEMASQMTLEQSWLDVSITPGPGTAPEGEPLDETLRLLQSDLRDVLNSHEAIILSNKFPFRHGDKRIRTITVVAKQSPARLVDELDDQGMGDVSITLGLTIHVPLADGDWLTIRTKSSPPSLWRMAQLFIAPVLGIVMVLLAATWTARSLVAPLQQLSSAVEKLGRERHVTELPVMSIPEYKSISNAFSEMQTQIKRFVDDRTNMLAAISHDLRTFLTKIRLVSDGIEDAQAKQELLKNISGMDQIIKEYLLFARNESSQESYVQTDIASLLQSVCDTLSDAGSQALYLGPDHAQLICQPVGMRRAMNNLIENACKYGERATVTLTDRADAIQIMIEDTGPGIPPQLVERAFEPFQRLEASRNRETGGTGLGLSIARNILHAHGGDIALRNLPKGGLQVLVTLPKPPVPTRQAG